MASSCTPHVSFTAPGEHIGLDSLADISPPGQAKGFGQCNDRVMSCTSTIKPRTSDSDESRPSVTGCHEEHKLFAWQATRAHVDSSGGAFRGPIRAIAALLPAGLVLNGNACVWPVRPAVSVVFMAASWPGPARFTNVKPGSQVLQPAPSSVTRPPKTGSQSILSR